MEFLSNKLNVAGEFKALDSYTHISQLATLSADAYCCIAIVVHSCYTEDRRKDKIVVNELLQYCVVATLPVAARLSSKYGEINILVSAL